jgi:ABC-type sugar transport system substrate-binding protein
VVVQWPGEDSDPHMTGDHAQDTAAHAAFCRQPDIVSPFSGKIIHFAGIHDGQQISHILGLHGPYAGNGVDALIDEMEKGYRLGKALITAARRAGLGTADTPLNIVDIGGDFTWFGSRLREKGLVRAVEEAPPARLLQVVPTHWTQAEGKKIAELLINRYPLTSVFRAASDQLGIGAAEALVNAGLTIGQNVFLGGLDLSLNGLQHLKNGQLIATVASSLFAYAEIVVYLYDCDFVMFFVCS